MKKALRILENFILAVNVDDLSFSYFWISKKPQLIRVIFISNSFLSSFFSFNGDVIDKITIDAIYDIALNFLISIFIQFAFLNEMTIYRKTIFKMALSQQMVDF